MSEERREKEQEKNKKNFLATQQHTFHKQDQILMRSLFSSILIAVELLRNQINFEWQFHSLQLISRTLSNVIC